MTIERVGSNTMLPRSMTGEAGDQEKARGKLRELCQEFESLFLYQLMKEMRKAVPRSDLVPKGLAEDIFRDLQDQELARRSAQTGSLGLGALLYEQLSRYLDDPGRKGQTPGETQ